MAKKDTKLPSDKSRRAKSSKSKAERKREKAKITAAIAARQKKRHAGTVVEDNTPKLND